MKKCQRFIVYGKVQGVFFRASTQQQALVLGLTGYAKNLSNGCVEVEIYGETVALEKMRGWLDSGSTMARVDKVVEVDTLITEYTHFRTL